MVQSFPGGPWIRPEAAPDWRRLARRARAPLTLALLVAAFSTFAGALGLRFAATGRAVLERPPVPALAWLVVRQADADHAAARLSANSGLALVRVRAATELLDLAEHGETSRFSVLEVATSKAGVLEALERQPFPGLVKMIRLAPKVPIGTEKSAGQRWLVAGFGLLAAGLFACVSAGLAGGRALAREFAGELESLRLLGPGGGFDIRTMAAGLLGGAMVLGSVPTSVVALVLFWAVPITPEFDSELRQVAWLGSSLGFALSAWVIGQAGVRRATRLRPRSRGLPGVVLAILFLPWAAIAETGSPPRAVIEVGRDIAVQTRALRLAEARQMDLELLGLDALARGDEARAGLARTLWAEARAEVGREQLSQIGLFRARAQARTMVAAWQRERNEPRLRVPPFAELRRASTAHVLAGSVALRDARGGPARAVADGRVAFLGTLPGWGRVLVLDHGHRTHSVYGRMARFGVDVGDLVSAGEALGRGNGKSGTIWFGLRRRGRAIDPVAWWRAGRSIAGG